MQNINISLRFRLLKCYVWSTLTYGVETWTISRAMSRRLEAFEMWCYRRMLRISYTEHKTNEEVLGMMKIKRLLIDSIRKRKAKGQIFRAYGKTEWATETFIRRENKRKKGKRKAKNYMGN